MTGNVVGTPDNTAVRTALWRALQHPDEAPVTYTRLALAP